MSDKCKLNVATINVGLGWTKKADKLLEKCSKCKLDIVGIQEIGDPVDVARKAMQYGYHAILCGKERRGVCLLINQDLEPWIRKEMKTDKDGRMVGMVLEIKGERIVVVNVYMPTGLDFVGSDDEKCCSHNLKIFPIFTNFQNSLKIRSNHKTIHKEKKP